MAEMPFGCLYNHNRLYMGCVHADSMQQGVTRSLHKISTCPSKRILAASLYRLLWVLQQCPFSSRLCVCDSLSRLLLSKPYKASAVSLRVFSFLYIEVDTDIETSWHELSRSTSKGIWHACCSPVYIFVEECSLHVHVFCQVHLL